MREGGATRVESEKHGDGFSYAKGSNKGERRGGFASCVGRFVGRVGAEDLTWKRHTTKTIETHTIFVDNLPTEVIKRTFYKEFGKDGYISDIFVSRKTWRKTNSTFAFISYNSYGEVTCENSRSEFRFSKLSLCSL
ncbi:hypothetical protein PIB30_056200 [Stylosanthes scabra]|uniref:RRM domain-containing protein n=1 Tax=Stylosanthes scabra TaxID=79078 RepID=A0ABU6XKJ5_9FABA|nr:hypothetical protein [Stylosanthes scabra]